MKTITLNRSPLDKLEKRLNKRNIHRLRKIISTIELQFMNLEWYRHFDHRILHSERVARILNSLVSGSIVLNQEEFFLAIASAWLHDVGYVIWNDIGDEEYISKALQIDSPLSFYYKATRETPSKDMHSKLSRLYVMRNVKKFSLTKAEAEILSEVCFLHAVSDLDDYGFKRTIVEDKEVRVRLLASLLRLADTLDIDFSLERILSPANSLARLTIDPDTLEIAINVKTIKGEQIESDIRRAISLAIEEANHVLSQHNFERQFSLEIFFLESLDPPLARSVLAALSTDVALQNLMNYVEDREYRLKYSLATRGRRLDDYPDMFLNFKRWNSTSPIRSSPSSKGGGYFLVWHHQGVLVDPGYDCLEAFLIPFTIDDIDAVIVTHDHPDHCNDLPMILNLLHDLNEIKVQVGLRPKEIGFFVSSGVDNRYGDMLRSEPAANVTVISPGRPIPLTGLRIECQSTQTQHPEISGGNNGFGLRIRSMPRGRLDLGITGDTAYFRGLESAFDGVRVLVAHLGRLGHPVTRGFSDKHLSFTGIVTLVSQLSVDPDLVIVGEFGEEMNGKRKMTCDKLEEHILNQGRRVRCIPADRDMVLSLERGSLRVGRGPFCNSIVNLRITESEETSIIYYD